MYAFRKLMEKELSNIDYLIKSISERSTYDIGGSLYCRRYKGSYYYCRQWRDKNKTRKEYLGLPWEKPVIRFKTAKFNAKRLKVLRKTKPFYCICIMNFQLMKTVFHTQFIQILPYYVVTAVCS